MLVHNDKPAAAPGHKWVGGDDIEVPDELAAVLIAIKDGGFSHTNRPATVIAEEVKRGPGRPPKVQTEVDPASVPA